MADRMADGAASTIDPREAAHFGGMAAQWWDPKGSSAMLHRLNPVRLGYLRERVDAHWAGDPASLKPLAGRRALDVGCGAGLLTEPLARLGADVTGVDAAPENIAAASAHAAAQGIAIDYRAGGIEAVAGETFDLVTSLEVIEHVADPSAFVAGLAACLAPGGLLILSTPNRTALSRLALITVGEGLAGIPRGTHDWDRFLTPPELTVLVEAAGLTVRDIRGIALSPTRGFVLSDDLAMDYLVSAVRDPDGSRTNRATY
jgi:2-polyprenyl-6-hydroxyphenyl methylase/3-demethylubiquinone-9 3-methyltransferase